VYELSQELAALLADAVSTDPAGSNDTPKKKRKLDNANQLTLAPTSPWSAASYALLSRILRLLLVAAVGKGVGVEQTGHSPEIVAVLEASKPAWTDSTKQENAVRKKRSKSDWQADVLAAGQSRLITASERLGLAAEAPGVSKPIAMGAEATFEKARQLFRLSYHRILTRMFLQVCTWLSQVAPDTEDIEALLVLLSGKERSEWTGRIADLTEVNVATAAWHALAQNGLTSLGCVCRESLCGWDYHQLTYDLSGSASASADQLLRFARLLIAKISVEQPLANNQSSQEQQAVKRLLTCAETWECRNLRCKSCDVRGRRTLPELVFADMLRISASAFRSYRHVQGARFIASLLVSRVCTRRIPFQISAV
jgi:hypothetical protein